MYDHAGEWMLQVGLPAKSGVAGGVCAVLPGHLGIGLYSPPLDDKGNSVRSVLACREMSDRFALHLLRSGGQAAHPVRNTYRGDTVSSKRIRPKRDRVVLDQSGATIVVHELQGDLDFSSTERVVRTVCNQLEGVSWIVFDLRRIGVIDEAAISLLAVLLAELAERGITTLFADPRQLPAVAGLMRSDWSTEQLRDLETALEWCEESLLMRADLTTLPPTVRVPFGAQELLAELSRDEVTVVRTLTESRTYLRGFVIFDEGDPADSIYFVTRGLVNVEARAGKAPRWFRLNTVPAGTAFGELALVDGGLRSSRIVVAEDAECDVLSVGAFENLRRENPRVDAGLTGLRTTAGHPQRLLRISDMPSLRVAVLRNCPRTAEVTVRAPGLRTPRMDMHRCSASSTTMTPLGDSACSRASAICVVSRSCT